MCLCDDNAPRKINPEQYPHRRGYLTAMHKLERLMLSSSFPACCWAHCLLLFPCRRHAGFSYSGPAAAYAYKCVDTTNIERVFILGPSHHVYLNGCALSRCDEYETPLGNLKIDKDAIASLMQSKLFTYMTLEVDEDEHSIEMQLPFLFKIMERNTRPFAVVPVLIGAIDSKKEAVYGKLLAPYLNEPNTLFIISSDFCHWGQRFRYTFKDADAERGDPIYKSIERLDRRGMDAIETLDPKQFADYLRETDNTICGRHPIGVLLNAIQHAGADQKSREHLEKKDKILQAEDQGDGLPSRQQVVEFIHYAQSSRVRSERESSVSYASGYYANHPSAPAGQPTA
ncbi:putative dioxygenase [Polychytrium aggregatum]|uniref:putative dioxygenase n=1 Tax=Polychytrium aggregatum TaxID=110093 RepID=UPI0022FDFB70|nr:putative dioxygenase [Polychytrium aggregatum]KAI9207081.1 putative dioxygenase [Polychytrium aggregatum]